MNLRRIIFVSILFLFLIGFIFIGVYFSSYNLVAQHESAHQEIFTEYNISSKISINPYTLSGQTTKVGNGTCNADCQLAHNQNEIVGYHIMAMGLQLWIMWLVTMVTILTIAIISMVYDRERN